MKKLFPALTILSAIALLSVSCSDSKDADFITKQSVSPTFIVMSEPGGQTSLFTDVSYVIWYNYTAGTADIDLTGLKNAGGSFYPTLKFRNLKFQENSEGWKTITATNIVPTTANGMPGPTFISMELNLKDRYFSSSEGMSYLPGFFVNLVADNGARYIGSLAGQAFIGDVVSSAGHETNIYCTTPDVSATIKLTDVANRKMSISLVNFKMRSDEEPYSLMINDLAFTTTSTGVVESRASGPIEVVAQGPLAKVILSDIAVRCDFTGDYTIEFNMKAGENQSLIQFSGNINTDQPQTN